MKKIWKNMVLCGAVALSMVGTTGCSKTKPEVSVDLDRDGSISTWETIYDKANYSNRQIPAGVDVVDISDISGLKAINDNTETKIYRLVKDIDCNGETLSINLRKSTLYGNNCIIKNFKLGKCTYSLGADEQAQEIENNIYGLFYNATQIFDLRLFMGYQEITLDNVYENSVVSPIINAVSLDNIQVKGKVKVKRLRTDGLQINTLDVSLVSASLKDRVTHTDVVSSNNISNVTFDGEIIYEEQDSNTNVRIGGLVPYSPKGSNIYNVFANVNINAQSNGRIVTGGIVGENDDFLSTCTAKGEITTTYSANVDNKIGGIVGLNNRYGEIKNATSEVAINFDKGEEETSKAPEYYAGGIVGYNYGVASYITSDSVITVKNAIKSTLGGIAGVSIDGVFDNVISRGSINAEKITTLYVSEMIGTTKNGHIESCVVDTNVYVDNSAINSRVYLGMLTMFEDFGLDAKYNALNSPNFIGIVLNGKTSVYMKPTDKNNFHYNLGLRNLYETYVMEDGAIKQEPVLDYQGNVMTDENGDPIYRDVTETILPDKFTKLYYSENYSIEKFSGDLATHTKDTLDFTYAKDGQGQDIVSGRAKASLNSINFYVDELGFKYGLNHSELDLSEMEINKFKFTLKNDQAVKKYFENKKYNGELAYFDRYLDSSCKFDNTDEMFSLINSLILSDSSSEYFPIKVSKHFAKSMELTTNPDDEENWEDVGENEEDAPVVDSGEMLSIDQNFIINVKSLVDKMFNVDCQVYTVSSNKEIYDSNNTDEEYSLKYYRVYFQDASYRYYLTFDVTQMLNDVEELQSDYIIYLQYTKAAIYS